MMDRYLAHTRAGVVAFSLLSIPQREFPIAPFHRGAGALQHLRKVGGLLRQAPWRCWRQWTKASTGNTQREAKTLGQRTPWRAIHPGLRRGHALEIQGADARGVEGARHG